MTTTPIIHINTPMITFLHYINYANLALLKSSSFKSYTLKCKHLYFSVKSDNIIFNVI